MNFSKELMCELRLTSVVNMSGKGELSFPTESMCEDHEIPVPRVACWRN